MAPTPVPAVAHRHSGSHSLRMMPTAWKLCAEEEEYYTGNAGASGCAPALHCSVREFLRLEQLLGTWKLLLPSSLPVLALCDVLPHR